MECNRKQRMTEQEGNKAKDENTQRANIDEQNKKEKQSR